MQDELITIKQCRDLRTYSYEFTKDCLLTQAEYKGIMKIFLQAYKRIEILDQKLMEKTKETLNYDI